MASPDTTRHPIKQASYYDTFRVFVNVIIPTLSKGVIKRRPLVEAAAQHLGLDTQAVQLVQSLRQKYGTGPLLFSLPFHSHVLILDPKDALQILNQTPVPFSPATPEKKSALGHFEPGNILISDPERRKVLRPVHEEALATNQRNHPLAKTFKTVIHDEFNHLFPPSSLDSQNEITVTWDSFSTAWFRIVRRIVLGDRARDDENLTKHLDEVRKRGNWGFTKFADQSKMETFQTDVAKYLDNPEPNSLVSRLPTAKAHDLELPSQVAQWLFAFDPAGMETFRALALLGCEVEEQNKARGDVDLLRAVFLDAVRLWPTTPVILRETTEDKEVGGTVIPKGTGVIIFAPFFHRDDKNFDGAHHLVANQWKGREVLEERGFFPFSAGPAICPAHNLVPMVGGLALFDILSRGKVEVVRPKMEAGALPGTLDHFEIEVKVKKEVS